MNRIGIGYDLHRLIPGRALVLGGVRISYEKGLAGHSDADVLAHAIIDALLGAAALGNIGQFFPDDSPQYAGANSLDLLREIARRVAVAGYSVANIDANVVAEQPKLTPSIGAMRANIAQCIGIPEACVSVKAKTNEGVGAEGRGEAISAHAIAMIETSDPSR